jgi:ATP-dependent DNA helicase PIF1
LAASCCHDDFFAETVVSNDVEYMPPDARSTLNPEQRLVYDTHIGHFQQRDVPPICLQVDGGAAGKSYMVKVLSFHLQQASLSEKSPIIRAAPTGVASNQLPNLAFVTSSACLRKHQPF